MKFELKNEEKAHVFEEIKIYLNSLGLKITSQDSQRPWGGFFVIDEQQAKQFADIFFSKIDLSSLKISGRLSPKILVVEPEKKLSWQYHHRRAEIWRVVSGPVGVVTSIDDIERESQSLIDGQEIRLKQGQRHRLIGLTNWGILAEIWQHTDVNNPSDENDIVRLQDDFGR
jgi:mannose-6-phosphate isomerase